jgi:hypothetical protein
MQHEPEDEKNGGWKDWIGTILCCLPMIASIIVIALGSWGLR